MDEVSKVNLEKSSVNNENENINISVEKSQETAGNKSTSNGTGSSSIVLSPYVEAVIKESMRKYPVIATGSRRLVKQKGGVLLSRKAKENRPEESYLIP